MLKELHAKGVGPQSEYNLDLGSRLNLFTGDNGLGKTFILDLLWYGCTWTWADEPAHPRSSSDETPSIESVLDVSTPIAENPVQARYDWTGERWIRGKKPSDDIAMLGIYASVQNSYAVWDTVRTPFLDGEGENALFWPSDGRSPVFPDSYKFVRETLWKGLQFQGKTICNGILSDLVNWQYSPKAKSRLAFETLEKVLKELSAPDELLKFGQTMRLSTADVRDIPTILMPYGEIPIVHASSAIRRIIEISYLLVWSWLEHLEAAKLKKLPVAKTIVLVIDEVENHLHPKWQRAILPALLRVVNCLSEDVKVQLFVTTHSPLVLASLENEVGADDRLFLLTQSNNEVTLVEEDWVKRGEASSWFDFGGFWAPAGQVIRG